MASFCKSLFPVSFIPGVPKKCQHLINNKTKAFCLISKLFYILNEAYLNLDFEAKTVEIR